VSNIETRQLFGRRQIYTDVETITADNVVEVLRQALSNHAVNQGEIQYLWDYYKGKTPILSKAKEIRESINHKICVNRANEIVTFEADEMQNYIKECKARHQKIYNIDNIPPKPHLHCRCYVEKVAGE